jgi:hypothetical protein
MSMQIGAMFRALLGDAAPADSRTLELRIGQIVRGVLMQMLDGGEALININGMPIRARLEADLPVGRGTLLQVQPGSNGSVIVLKPLADMTDAVPDETMKDVLKSFGLPDQKWSYELIRGLKRDGYPIGNDTASFFRAAVAMKPATVDVATWMSAADVAFRRGLPASEETIGVLRQTLAGPPLGESLASFAASFKQWANGEDSGIARSSAWVGRMLTLLAQGEQLLAQGGAQLGAGTGAAQAQVAGTQMKAGGPAEQMPEANQPRAARDARPMIGTPLPPADAAVILGRAPAGGGQGAPMAAVNIQPGVARQVPDQPPAATANATTANGWPAGTLRPDAAVETANRQTESIDNRAMMPNRGEAGQAIGPGARTETNWIGRFLQWLGVDHEHRLMQQTADIRQQDGTLPTGDKAMPLAEGKPAVTETSRQAAFETLKSALLSLLAQDEVPPSLREAAQTLVSQITGQQLLLSSERQPNQLYSMMTLFVPMKGEDGDTTATVHVQTRRSRKGEWDADNCRLLFDLRMRHLGDTIVDVQVVDRIVSVKLMNDHPDMAMLVEQARGELVEGLRAAGFQLLSLHAQPLPAVQPPQPADSEETAERHPLPLSSAYAAKPYKGVDFRI